MLSILINILSRFIPFGLLMLFISCVTRIGNVVLPVNNLEISTGVDTFLHERFQEDQGKNPNSVLMVALSKDGVTQIYRYGDAKQFDKFYAIGSLSKTLTAALIAKLVHAGQLSYNDRVQGVSILNLLTHTGGVRDFGMDLNSLIAFTGFAWRGDGLYRRVDLNRLEKEEADCTPAAFHYSTIAYALLQKHLEARFESTFDPLMMGEILLPLAMNHTFADPPIEQRADGYPGEYPLFMLRSSKIFLGKSISNPLMLAAAGYWSTLDDLVKMVEALRKGEKFLLDLKQSVVQEAPFQRATIGLTVQEVKGVELTYKRGLSFGHTVYIGYRENVSVVVLRNSLRMTDEIGHSLLLGLLGV